MHARKTSGGGIVVVCAAAILSLAWVAGGYAADGKGLYGDEAKDVKSGDINDQDYWWTKFDMMMLDLALKQHQPEGKIGLNLASTHRRLDDLVKKYPNHDELKKWKEKVETIEKKINPDAPRGVSFNPGCPWDESNFAQLWVNYHHAKMKLADNQRDEAIGLLQNVKQNCGFMTRPDRMKDYPEDLRKFVEEKCPEVDKMLEDLKRK
jgi:hypothetical protein